jgi:hypothetical protein
MRERIIELESSHPRAMVGPRADEAGRGLGARAAKRAGCGGE